MNLKRRLLLRAFGRPRGLLGRIGGLVMARANRRYAEWAVRLLAVQPGDAVLEIGFGPGVAVELLAARTPAGYIAGIDVSPEMLAQAGRRNSRAIENGRVDLRHGSVETLPFAEARFAKAFAINSLQVWPDARAGLREIARVLQPAGTLLLMFTTHSGQGREGLAGLLASAGFATPRFADTEGAFAVVTTKA